MPEKNDRGAIGCGSLLGAILWAGTAAAEPVLTHDVSSAAGRQVSAAQVVIDGTMDAWSGQASAGASALRAGFVGQLYDVTSLQVSALPASVSEAQAVDFDVAGLCDDGSFLAADSEAWSILAGPLASLDGSGHGMAAPVYQGETGVVRVAALNFSATGRVAVLDTDPDNFGLYAHDQIQDLWQVGYFGPASTNGMAGANPDGDQDDNYQEFIVGTDPSSPQSAFRVALSRSGTLRMTGSPAYSSRVYRIERTTNLRGGAWTPVSEGTGALTNGQWAVAGLSDTNPAAQYRMQVEYNWR